MLVVHFATPGFGLTVAPGCNYTILLCEWKQLVIGIRVWPGYIDNARLALYDPDIYENQ